MQPESIKNKGRGRIFENDILEFFTRTSPLVIYCIYFPVIGVMLYYGHVHQSIAFGRETLLFIAGIFFWSLFEYFAHRFLFHLPANTPRAKRFVYMMHGIHHEYPRDKGRLFMPVIPSVTLATLIFLLMRLLMGWNALAFFPGFLLGYISYGSMHYAIHAYAPPRFMKALWRNHAMHHYETPDMGYGVSSVLWDHIFGTVPKLEKNKK